jgi:acyl carrier protein
MIEHMQTIETVSTTEALKWIAEVFHTDADLIKPETLRADILEWDSLGVLALMAAIDSDFGIIISDEELGDMNSVNDILDILRQAGKLGE